VLSTMWGMIADPGPAIAPVANPALPARRQRKLIDRALLKDPVGLAEPAYQLHDRDKIVVPSTLDEESSDLMFRAQAAIAACLGEDARAIEPDGAVPQDALLRHQWEIAVALRDITDLREEHILNAAGSVGPMTKAVLSSQQGALAQAQEGIAARVAELERYAERVGAAATAYHDWQEAQRVSDLNDRYLDLVARTAADKHAVTELSGLTEQAAAAAHTFQQTVYEMGLAAAALELP
jgi:hypothetical protein